MLWCFMLNTRVLSHIHVGWGWLLFGIGMTVPVISKDQVGVSGISSIHSLQRKVGRLVGLIWDREMGLKCQIWGRGYLRWRVFLSIRGFTIESSFHEAPTWNTVQYLLVMSGSYEVFLIYSRHHMLAFLMRSFHLWQANAGVHDQYSIFVHVDFQHRHHRNDGSYSSCHCNPDH